MWRFYKKMISTLYSSGQHINRSVGRAVCREYVITCAGCNANLDNLAVGSGRSANTADEPDMSSLHISGSAFFFNYLGLYK